MLCDGICKDMFDYICIEIVGKVSCLDHTKRKWVGHNFTVTVGMQSQVT